MPIRPSPKVLALCRSRRVRIAANVGLLGLLGTVAALTIRHFAESGWPLVHADGRLVAAAGLLFLGAFAFKAFGWRRLFAHHERPGSHALAAATGAATVTGVALPGRFDDLVRIAVARRFRCSKAGLGALVLTIVVVGFLDSVALIPLASVAAGLGDIPGGVRAGLATLAAIGMGAALLVVAMPRLRNRRRLARFRLVRWISEHCACTREAMKACCFIAASWSLRALALYALLAALGVSRSFTLALLFLCASAASAAMPIAPAGAATQAGGGAAVLALSGIATSEAVAFAISAQALFVLAAAAVVVAAGAWEARLRLRPALASR
jgi:uncharacterized membrane protein YbhN (UPF0104 family)